MDNGLVQGRVVPTASENGVGQNVHPERSSKLAPWRPRVLLIEVGAPFYHVTDFDGTNSFLQMGSTRFAERDVHCYAENPSQKSATDKDLVWPGVKPPTADAVLQNQPGSLYFGLAIHPCARKCGPQRIHTTHITNMSNGYRDGGGLACKTGFQHVKLDPAMEFDGADM
jgi:hypothetical protein